MKKIRVFVKSTVIGGLLVILPSAVFIFILNWIFGFVHNIINPLTRVVMEKSPFQGYLADFIVILLIVFLCFILGVFVRTRIGKWALTLLEKNILFKIPGYTLIKDTITPFLGSEKSPFSSVALAKIYNNETLATVFITDRHDDGSYTVFFPSGPVPSNGFIYHLPKSCVFPIEIPVEDAMRSIISCGAGSKELIRLMKQSEKKS